MDSRQEPRLEIDQEISLTLLGAAETAIPARIVNVSGKGIGLESSRPLPPGSALKIELADTLLLGEVVYCRERGARYQVGIALEQALYNTRGLAALAERLLGGTSGQRTHAAVERDHQDG
jgi:hypothetical protein